MIIWFQHQTHSGNSDVVSSTYFVSVVSTAATGAPALHSSIPSSTTACPPCDSPGGTTDADGGGRGGGRVEAAGGSTEFDVGG